MYAKKKKCLWNDTNPTQVCNQDLKQKTCVWFLVWVFHYYPNWLIEILSTFQWQLVHHCQVPSTWMLSWWGMVWPILARRCQLIVRGRCWCTNEATPNPNSWKPARRLGPNRKLYLPNPTVSGRSHFETHLWGCSRVHLFARDVHQLLPCICLGVIAGGSSPCYS